MLKKTLSIVLNILYSDEYAMGVYGIPVAYAFTTQPVNRRMKRGSQNRLLYCCLTCWRQQRFINLPVNLYRVKKCTAGAKKIYSTTSGYYSWLTLNQHSPSSQALKSNKRNGSLVWGIPSSPYRTVKLICMILTVLTKNGTGKPFSIHWRRKTYLKPDFR